MRCKSCDYTLWQIRDRRCPECGTGFKPSEFEFVLNSVRFCCPHCNQAYYGTGANGHLVPSEFDCVNCANRISMDEMILLPTEGVRDEQTKVEMNPWLERRERGIIRGLFNTVIQSMGTPGRLIRATPENSSLLQATWYATLINALYLLGGISLLLVLFLVIGIVSATTGGAGPGGGGIGGAMAPATVFVGYAIGMVVAMVVGAFIWGVMAHGLLLLTGPTAAGLGRTMQCMLYSSGTNIANAVPCLGFYIGWMSTIWWTVSATLMLKDGQKVSGGRAALATILPIVVSFLLVIAIIVFAVIMPIQRAVGAAQTAAVQAQVAQAAPSNDPARVLQLAAAIKMHAADYGEPPKHAAELIDTQRIWVNAFIRPSYNDSNSLQSARIVGMSLEDLGSASGETTDALIAAASASLPDNVIAHRIGDTIFCYHGIDFATADPELWTVISSPEPGTATTQSEVTVGIVGTPGGTNIHTFPTSTLASALATQNTLRAAAGLHPLPDPSSITADKPALAE